MVLEASFGSIKFEQLEGYRISAAYAPQRGIEGNFFIYLVDWVPAQEEFSSPIVIDVEPQVDDLVIADGGDVDYSFPKMTLSNLTVGATRQRRYRMVEFTYLQDADTGISVSNSRDRELDDNALRDAYDYDIGGGKEHLLGFRCMVSSSDANVFRFATIRNNKNSFMEKILEANNSYLAKSPFKLDLKFSQQDFSASASNLNYFFVDESFGTFLSVPLSPLSDYQTLGANNQGRDLITHQFADHTMETLLAHDFSRMQGFQTGESVETATLVFRPGQYRDVEIT